MNINNFNLINEYKFKDFKNLNNIFLNHFHYNIYNYIKIYLRCFFLKLKFHHNFCFLMKVNLCYHLIIIFLLITMFYNFREDYLRIIIIIHFLILIDQFIIINLFYFNYMCLLLFIFKYLMIRLIFIISQFLKFIKDFSFKISNLSIINFINNQKIIFL